MLLFVRKGTLSFILYSVTAYKLFVADILQ